MSESRENTLATSIVERLKEYLNEAVNDEDYTKIVQLGEEILGEDEEVEELFDLVGEPIGDEDFDDEFDDLDEDFDDEDEDLDDEDEDEYWVDDDEDDDE